MPLYRYKIDKGELLKFKKVPKRLGAFRPAHVSFSGYPLPQSAKSWCAMYEGILRNVYKECDNFNCTIKVGRKFVYLNKIDDYSSKVIERVLKEPSKGTIDSASDVLNAHSMFPEVIAMVTCRNLGIPYKRLVSDSKIFESYKWIFTGLDEPIGLPTRKQSAKGASYLRRLDIVLDLKKPIVLQGQADPFASGAALDRSANKAETNRFLADRGYHIPKYIVINSKRDIVKCAGLRAPVFIKPVEESLRIGVIGPIWDPSLLGKSYNMAMSQISEGQRKCLCQEGVRGEEFRINCNFGKITFAAKTIKGYVIGDGRSSIAQLLEKRRKKYNAREIKADYINNILAGSGLTVGSVVEKGRRIRISLNGSEEGRFIDATGSLDVKYKRLIKRLAGDLGLNVVGVDVLIDREGTAWIIDVNNSPYVAFFDSAEKSYATMEHMIRCISMKIGRKDNGRVLASRQN